MSDNELMPMIANLIKSVRAKPTEEELRLLRQPDVKEMRIFFDALSSGKPEQQIYDEILAHVRQRYGHILDAERAAEEAARKQKEAEDAAKRAVEEAERLRREAEAAAARKAAEEEVARVAAAEEAERVARLAKDAAEKAAADRREKEAAAAAAAEAERKRKEEEERLAREREEQRLADELALKIKSSPGKCVQCGEYIFEKDFLKNDELILHAACLPAYEEATCAKCAHCGKIITGDFAECGAPDGGRATVHEDCLQPFKLATRPKCGKCSEPILEDRRLCLDGVNYHVACAPQP